MPITTALQPYSPDDGPLDRWGEIQVLRLLTSQNWNILGQNIRGIGFEVDLAAQKKGSLIVVEVKTRNRVPQNLCELAPISKQRCLAKGLNHVYSKVKNHHEIETMRIDLALIVCRPICELSYFPNCFTE